MGAQPDASALARAEGLVGGFVRGFRPECWSGPDAACLVESFGRLERLAAAGKALAAGRVEATNGWKAAGYATPEEWLAATSGTSVAAAGQTLTMARRLGSCPGTERALREGKLSASQASVVASAASVDPASEDGLSGPGWTCRPRGVATSGPVGALGRSHPRIDLDAIHRSRYLCHWTSEDGAVEGRFRLTPDQGATVLAALRAFHGQVFDQARNAGEREAPDAYEADALVAMAHASTTSTPTTSTSTTDDDDAAAGVLVG